MKKKFNQSQTTADYLISFQDNQLIFGSFDAANISAFNNVKNSYMFIGKHLIKREIIESSEKNVLIGDIDCTELPNLKKIQ